jgi:hypothetical protein
VYPAAAVSTMPGPCGLPEETVSPEVSECSLIPCSLRRVSTAARPCPPSWAMVTTFRVRCHSTEGVIASSATAAVPQTMVFPGAAR